MQFSFNMIVIARLATIALGLATGLLLSTAQVENDSNKCYLVLCTVCLQMQLHVMIGHTAQTTALRLVQYCTINVRFMN